MLWTHVVLSLALFLTNASLRLVHFFLYIYMAHPPHSPYFILVDIRERKPVAFDFVNPFFTSVTLSVVILKAFLQKANLPVSFYFLPLFLHFLLIAE